METSEHKRIGQEFLDKVCEFLVKQALESFEDLSFIDSFTIFSEAIESLFIKNILQCSEHISNANALELFDHTMPLLRKIIEKRMKEKVFVEAAMEASKDEQKH